MTKAPSVSVTELEAEIKNLEEWGFGDPPKDCDLWRLGSLNGARTVLEEMVKHANSSDPLLMRYHDGEKWTDSYRLHIPTFGPNDVGDLYFSGDIEEAVDGFLEHWDTSDSEEREHLSAYFRRLAAKIDLFVVPTE